jgi:hypothetical protein
MIVAIAADDLSKRAAVYPVVERAGALRKGLVVES